MIGDFLQPTHLIFVLLVALLVLGPKRLPEVGRSLGKGIRDFKGAMNGITEETHDVFNQARVEVPRHEPEPTVSSPVASAEPTVSTPVASPEPAMSTAAASEAPSLAGTATEESPAVAPRNEE